MVRYVFYDGCLAYHWGLCVALMDSLARPTGLRGLILLGSVNSRVVAM